MQFDVLWTSHVYPSALVVPLFSSDSDGVKNSGGVYGGVNKVKPQLYSETPILNF